MNFLGGLSVPGFAGGMFPTERPNPFDVQGSGLDPAFDTSAGINDALARNQQLGQQRQQEDNGSGLLGKAFGQKAGGAVRNVLGAIADSLLVNAGHAPIYGPKKQAQQAEQRRARIGQMLGNYLGNSDAALAELFAEDPDTALEIYKLKNRQPEVTADQRNFDYYQGLDPAKRAAYENYLRLTHPGMMSPISMGANDTIEMPGAPAADSAPTATDSNGNKVKYNAQSGQWEPMGGPTPQASGDFL